MRLLLPTFLACLAGCLDVDLSGLTDVEERRPDVDPPVVLAISLGALDETPEGVSLMPRIRVTLSEPLDPATLDEDTVRIRADGEAVGIEWSHEGSDLVVAPTNRLAPLTLHELLLSATIRDLHGAPLSDPDGRAAPFEYSFVTGDGAAGPPLATLAEPAEGQTGVPTNLARVAVRFDEPVREGSITVAGRAVAAVLDERHMLAVAPLEATLPASRRVEVELRGFVDAEGNEPIADPLWFETASGPDGRPPTFVPVPCGVGEAPVPPVCVAGAGEVATLRLAADEAVRVEVSFDDGRTRIETTSAGSGTAHTITVRGLEPERTVTFEAVAIDLAGNETEVAGSFDSGTPLPSLVLSEVYADPVGPEPDQEFVEIVNVGASTVVLDGISVADGAGIGDPISGAPPLAMGCFAILVAPGYSPAGGADPPPAPGALVVRLAGPIGSNGLLNAGEPVSLVDADGRTVTVAPDLLTPRTGVSIERTDLSADPYDPGTWAHNPAGSATPGAPNAARR